MKEKNVIVQIGSGLGNQMFQYALAEKLSSLGKNVKLDVYTDYKKNVIRNYSLNIFKNIDMEWADEGICDKYFKRVAKIKNGRWYYSRIGKLFDVCRKIYIDREIEFNPKVISGNYSYLCGYWQTEKYFYDIRDVLLKKFQFPEINDTKNNMYISQIQNSNSVSLHVRRGDYVNEKNYATFGSICTLDYYEKAIAYFEDKYNDVTFFVFSNDLEWAKKNLQMKKVVFVEGNNEDNGYKDMYLMTQCKHNIVANSSFSWWGAWLNQNEEKQVIAPDKWINNEKLQDIWCDNWKRF